MDTSGPIGATNEEQQAADALISALSTIAYSTDEDEIESLSPYHSESDFVEADDPLEVTDRPPSRFLFKITKSFDSELHDRQQQFKKPKLSHVDQEITRRLKVYRAEAPAPIEKNIVKVREFILREIAPLSLAGEAGLIQAREIVQKLLKTQVDPQQLSKFNRMSEAAVNLLLARFVARYYGLSSRSVDYLLDSVRAGPPQTVIFQGNHPDDQHRTNVKKRREEQADAKKQVQQQRAKEGSNVARPVSRPSQRRATFPLALKDFD